MTQRYVHDQPVNVTMDTAAAEIYQDMQLPMNDDEYYQAFYNTDMACLTVIADNRAVMTSHEIFVYFALIFVFTGIIGNILSMIVFASADMRKVSSNVYLLFLSVSDTCYLLAVFLTRVLTTLRCLHATDSSLDYFQHRNTVFCKLFQFTGDLFANFSACLILAFTIERYLACYHAFRYREFCTVLRARIICLVIFVVIFTTTLPHHVLYIGRMPGLDYCTVLMEYEQQFAVLYGLEVLAYRIIPVFVIAILNVLIIIKVCHVHRKRQEQRGNSAVYLMEKNGSTRERRNWGVEGRHLQITIMLTIVSTAYVILYFPVMIHLIVWKLQRAHVILVSYEGMIVAQNITSVLYIGGFAINFLLYTISCKIFRDHLLHMLCRQRKYTEVAELEDISGGRARNGATETIRAKSTETHM